MFVFYDFETTGTNPAFIQPTQIAAILVDQDFNEVERFELRSRLSSHILPAPIALAITGVTPAMLKDTNLPSWFEFTKEIGKLIDKWSPATWIGYNNIAFDEEVLRHSFYQNLHPNLYKTQLSGNERMDLLKIIHAVYALIPDTLKWAYNSEGKLTFKLDKLAPANGFRQHNAHDALGDVEATIYLAKLIRQRAPKFWNQCLRSKNKSRVNSLLETGKPLGLVERFFSSPPRIYKGIFVGRDPTFLNNIGFLDLDQENAKGLLDCSDEDLMKAISISPKIIRVVSVNKFPTIFELEELSEQNLNCAALYSKNNKFYDRVGLALEKRRGSAKEYEFLEQKIYDGFYTSQDKILLEEFQSSRWERRPEIMRELSDSRLRMLGSRVIFVNRPDLIDDEKRAVFSAAIKKRWHSNDPKSPWYNVQRVQKELEELEYLEMIDKESLQKLREFYSELTSNFRGL